MTIRSAVFVSPVVPSLSGNGLAMRAAATLQLLRRWFDEVHLVIIPVSGVGEATLDATLASFCSSWQIAVDVSCSSPVPVPPALANIFPRKFHNRKHASAKTLERAVRLLSPTVVVVFRFQLLPFIEAAFKQHTNIWLDLDELESASLARSSTLFARLGRIAEANKAYRDSLHYEAAERWCLPRFERVFVSSEVEAQRTRTLCPQVDLRLLPNSYPFSSPQEARVPDGTQRLLFVGNFRYHPNQDAMTHFYRDIFPHIRKYSEVPVELTIVGSGLQPSRGDDPSGVRCVGEVSSVTCYYAACDAVIVPLRAGGGTRIKILEAFSHRRAVISTSVGVEGLDVKDEVNVLISDTPTEFAKSCLRLQTDYILRDQIAEHGHQRFLDYYSLDRVAGALPYLFGKE